mgnify:CR=1 FL=1|jgi:hypothetical protein
MNIETILNDWSEDCKIDETNLSHESTNIPILHSKYISMYTNAKLSRLRIYEKRKEIKRKLTEYYSGDLNNPEDIKEIGREPFNKKLLNTQVQTYVDSDDEMININLKIGYQDELIKLLEDIVKTIHTRNFIIKNSLDYQRFMNGG